MSDFIAVLKIVAEVLLAVFVASAFIYFVIKISITIKSKKTSMTNKSGDNTSNIQNIENGDNNIQAGRDVNISKKM